MFSLPYFHILYIDHCTLCFPLFTEHQLEAIAGFWLTKQGHRTYWLSIIYDILEGGMIIYFICIFLACNAVLHYAWMANPVTCYMHGSKF